MIRILLVDDQKTIREALRMMLESAPDIQVVGTASDGHTAIEQVSFLKPDVVLIDMEMPDMDGVSATKIISQKFSTVKVLVLSMHDDEALIAKSMQAGAMGYLLKNTPPQELRAAIRFIQRGYAQYGPGLLDKLVSVGGGAEPNDVPTKSEVAAFNAQPQMGSDSNSTSNSSSDSASQLLRHNSRPVHDLTAVESAEVSTQRNQSDRQLQMIPDQDRRAELQLEMLQSAQSETQETLPRGKWKRYLVLGLLLNAFLWTAALSVLKLKKPIYTSVWTLDLPAGRTDTLLEVPGVGRAAESNVSPYSNIMVADPRANYKDLFEGPEVLKLAADNFKVKSELFGSPKVEVVANTTLMKIAVDGLSPREAQQKANLVQNAFEAKIRELRKQELAQQNQTLKSALDSASERLKVAQVRLSNYKVESGLDSGEQLRDLSVNIEALRRQKAETIGQMQDSASQLQQLSANLGLSPDQAAKAFTLQSDALFQQYLLGYSKTSGELSSLESAYSVTHPRVVDKAEESAEARQRLFQRGEALLGHPVSEALLKQINVSNGINPQTQRSNLFQEVIELKGKEEGFKGQSAELDRQIQALEAKMSDLSKKKSVLVNLERDVQIAEAIFTSTLGKLDLTKSSFSAAYPQVTLRTKPNLPKLPSSPKVVPILFGTFLASSLLSLGLASLWYRDRRLQRLRLNRMQSIGLEPRQTPQLQPAPVMPSLPGQN